MRKKSYLKKRMKGFVSLLAALALTAGLLTPFEIRVSAEEEPAKPGEMHAIIYVIDTNKKNSDGSINYDNNLELVFQKGEEEDGTRTVAAHFENFGGADMENKNPPWRSSEFNKSSGVSNIIKVDFKDRIQPVSMCQWFESFRNVTSANFQHVENVDTSQCISMKQLFNYDYSLTTLDLSTWDVSKVKSMSCTFGRCWGLRELDLSSWTFESVTTMGMAFCGTEPDVLDISNANFSRCASMDRTFSIDGTYPTHKIKKIILPENMKVANKCDLYRMFYKQTDLQQVNLKNLQANNPYRMKEMFVDCKLFEEIDLSGITGTVMSGGGSSDVKESSFNGMFQGCSALKTVDLSGYSGPLKYTGDNSPFTGCENLVSVDFEKLNTVSGSVTDLTGKANMFADSPELSWIRLSDNWPAGDKIGSTAAIKGTWKKLDDPGKGTEKSNEELFRNFQSGYKGTWGALSAITFKGNGGTPAYQTVEGIKNDTITFGDDLTAARVGYDFAGWWPDKTEEPEGTSALQSGEEAEQWNYYAHWTPHTYDLVLDGNGGTVPDGMTIDGAAISQDRKTITFSSVSYPDFVELSSNMFGKAGNNTLSSWNTRANGTGAQYYVSDSVNQLTPTQGGTVTLFAQWDESDYVVTFDAQGGSSVSKKTYRQQQKYGSLSPSEKGGYTFLGWFTAAEGGHKITSDMTVAGDITLYAHWQENPKVYFDPCSGSTEIPFNVYNYGQKLGVVAPPEWGNRSFEGWYTAGECCYYTDGTKDGFGSFYAMPWPESNASPTAKDTITVKLTNNQNWDSVYVYAFDKDETVTMGAWPGTAMTYIGDNDYHEGIYSVEVPAATAKVVFSNGSNAAQTVDVTLTPGKGGALVESISDEIATGNAYYYAHWSYKPAFESNGGSFTSYDASNYPPQDSAAYTIDVLPVATKQYCSLDGWYWQYEENGVQKEQKLSAHDTIDLSKGTVIRAKWTPTTEPCTVTFIDKDPADPDNPQKTKTSSVQVYEGEKIRQLPTPTRDGYDFAGWFKEGASTPETADSTFRDDTALYAHWNAKNIVITFNPNGGTLSNGAQQTISVSNGGGIDVLPNATLENKVLAGWYLKDDGGNFVDTSRLISNRALPDTNNYGVTITDNKTYYAKWTDPETLEDNGFFKCEAEWEPPESSSITNYGDTLVFRPTSNGTISAHLSMAFERVQNKQYDIPEGALKIKMPVSVFKDKNGNDVGTNNINGNDQFARTVETIDGRQYYVYTNTKVLKDDSGFEFHYNVDPTLLAAKTGDDLFYKNDFKVYIEYSDDNHTVNYDRDLSVEVHTGVTTTVKKAQASVSLVWNTDWGEKPADADEYFYVTWSLSADNTNCSQKYRLYWREDTVHDGTIISSTNLNSWSAYQTGGVSTAQVVTKHRRSEVDSGSGWYTVNNEAILDIEMASGELLHYRAAANAYAYIPSSGGTGGLKKHIKDDYTVQQNHIKGYAQEYILNGNTASLTALDYAVTYTEEENTDTGITWSDKTNAYTTAERTMLLSDGNAGDLRISPVKGSNKYKWGDSAIEQNLNPGDYSFTYLKIWLTEYDAVKMNNTWSNPFRHRAEDYGDIIVRVKTTSNPTLEVVPIEDEDELNDYVEVTLPAGTYYYEIEHKTSFYTTDMRVETSVRLNITNRLQSIVSDHVYEGYRTLIKNKCDLDVTRSGSTESLTSARENDAWPAAYELTKGSSTLYTFKKCAAKSDVTEDPPTSTEEFPVLLTSWNYNTGSNLKYMKSGEFNDLLPPKCTVDADSVFVWRRTDGKSVNVNNTNDINNKIGIAVTKARYNSQKASADNLPAGNYSVILTPDWQGSGRTLLTVRMTVPDDKVATGFNVFYIMKTTYSNINRRGTNLTNPVSFTDTTYKQSKPNVRVGTLDSLDSDTKPYYASIDDDYTSYAWAQTDCVVPSIYTYGLTTQVQAEGSNLTEHEVVGLNANYSYHINYCNNYITDTLVFFDTIERRMDGTQSDWYGTMLGIDVSEIKKVASANSADGYCAPVIYYTTKDRTLLSKDDFDLTSSIWTQTAPSDLSSVTAVAVDCRKTTTNQDFVLAKKQNLGFSINMRSPSDDINSNDITYNEAVMKGKITDNNMAVSSYSYTDVTVIFSEPEFHKTAFPNTGTQASPAGVVQNSVLAYYLKIKNPDETTPIHNIVVEDVFINSLNFNNTITVKIDEGAEIAIDKAARVSSYSIDPVNNEAKVKFSAVIASVAPGETITIKIPVTVSAPITTVLTNKAKITAANDVTYAHPIESDETFHKVTGTKAKILKIKSNGSALAGAELEIYENNAANFNASTGKIKSGATALELRNDGVLVGEGANHDYFTSTTEVMSFDIAPGNYVLHEKTLPAGYETAAADIPFRVDIEGIHYIKKNNKEEPVSDIEMINTPPYQVIYHTNLPTGTDEVFKTVDSPDLVQNKVTAFSEIPTFSGDKYYSFTGWYTLANGGEKVAFDRTYTQTTHLYAHWHAYKVIFHANNPNDPTDDVFRSFTPSNNELNVRGGVTHFYDIPSFAGDEYVFAGWYHSESYLKDDELEGAGESLDTPADFEKDTYLKKDAGAADPDYHLYAKWIEVGTVSQQTTGNEIDTNDYGGASLRGFGLAGVQIREEELYDPNERDPGVGGEEYNNAAIKTPGGLRFVTSVSESLLTQVKGISKISSASAEAKNFGVEYGYVVGTEMNLARFIDGVGNSWEPPITGNYKGVDLSKYRLQYNGGNVNGVDTTGKTSTADTDYRYITNVNCTSKQKATADCGVVRYDHKNFNDYRLYTLVVTYDNDAESKSKKLDARSYMRYYDANGKLRVFYNDYKNNEGTTYYGGCMCSYDQVNSMS